MQFHQYCSFHGVVRAACDVVCGKASISEADRLINLLTPIPPPTALVLVLMQAAVQYMVYGKAGIFDADRLIDLLNAFYLSTFASQSFESTCQGQC